MNFTGFPYYGPEELSGPRETVLVTLWNGERSDFFFEGFYLLVFPLFFKQFFFFLLVVLG